MARRKLIKKILRSQAFQKCAAHLIHNILKFIYATNKTDPDIAKQYDLVDQHKPVILAMWHGQHILVPYARNPSVKLKLATLVSKSADAEINANVLKLAGAKVIRGSGGRNRNATHEKGGVSATIAMKNALKDGYNIGIIADISKGEPRKSGKGIISLAKISGCPIVPLALATSRFKVIKGSWDQTTINLPFGRSCVRLGNPIYVPSDASVGDIDVLREKLDDDLNRITDEVYANVGHTL